MNQMNLSEVAKNVAKLRTMTCASYVCQLNTLSHFEPLRRYVRKYHHEKPLLEDKDNTSGVLDTGKDNTPGVLNTGRWRVRVLNKQEEKSARTAIKGDPGHQMEASTCEATQSTAILQSTLPPPLVVVVRIHL